MPTRMRLSTPTDFNFPGAVCSHGFFVLRPNRWEPASAQLTTVIALNSHRAIEVTIRQGAGRNLHVTCSACLAAEERARVRAAVRRMLRVNEDFADFHRRCRSTPSHRQAARVKFGRLLRGADLFEDIIKVICTCNVAWRQTVAMVEHLVAHWGIPTDDGCGRAFPSAPGLARVPIAELRRKARVGYRATFIQQTARSVAEGRCDLDALSGFEGSSDDLMRELRQLAGIGPYAAANLCMLLGRYDQLAIDTEMKRLLADRFGHGDPTPAKIRAHYAPWAPYQFLAYWFELWQDYTRRLGRPEHWTPEDIGRKITTASSTEDPHARPTAYDHAQSEAAHRD